MIERGEGMKVTVQQKIAELESRIAALEKAKVQQRSGVKVVEETTTMRSSGLSPEMVAEWKQMWHHFEQLFKKTFIR